MIIMKKIYFTLIALLASINMLAQGWPANYSGVMLQGFSWDSYDYSQWTVLEKQADDMKGFIDLVWLPQSGKCFETTQVMAISHIIISTRTPHSELRLNSEV